MRCKRLRHWEWVYDLSKYTKREIQVRRLDPKTRHTQHMKINEKERRKKHFHFVLLMCSRKQFWKIHLKKHGYQQIASSKTKKNLNLKILFPSWFWYTWCFTWCTSKRENFFWSVLRPPLLLSTRFLLLLLLIVALNWHQKKIKIKFRFCLASSLTCKNLL